MLGKWARFRTWPSLLLALLITIGCVCFSSNIHSAALLVVWLIAFYYGIIAREHRLNLGTAISGRHACPVERSWVRHGIVDSCRSRKEKRFKRRMAHSKLPTPTGSSDHCCCLSGASIQTSSLTLLDFSILVISYTYGTQNSEAEMTMAKASSNHLLSDKQP